MGKTRERIYTGDEDLLQKLDRAAETIGLRRGSKAVIGSNGIICYYSEGSIVLKKLQDDWEEIAAEAGQTVRRTWEGLSEEEQHTIASVAAGSISWADDGKLDSSYTLDYQPQSEMLNILYAK